MSETTRRGPRGPFFTPANVVSLLRVPLGACSIWLLAEGMRTAALLTMAAAFLSDALDGAIARRSQISDWGKILDPLCDKLVFALIGVSLAWMGVIPAWVIVLIVARDLFIAVGGVALALRRGIIPSANIGGKLSTVVLATWMVRQAFWPADSALAFRLDWLGLVAVALLVGSTVGYVIRAAVEKPRVLRPSDHPVVAAATGEAP